jgi:hypothetical protein
MMTTEGLLRRGLERHGDAVVLTLDPTFQGLPDTAHGGSVVAALHLLAGGETPAAVHGRYRRRVPLGIPLTVSLERRGTGWAARVRDASDAVLVEGDVSSALGPAPAAAVTPALDEAQAHPLPVAASCLACGTRNALGLQARLFFDDGLVAGTWRPRPPLAADGRLAPLAITTLLDEAAFWLGVLASGESGMTTDIALGLVGSVPFGPPITVAGGRAAVRPRAEDPRYWETEVQAWAGPGRLVAWGRITFVAVRGAARRLATAMLALNPPDVVRRAFPAYVS